MPKFRKKPVVVEAMQIPPAGYEHREAGKELEQWLKSGGCVFLISADATVHIKTLEGWMEGKHPDWIIKGVQGEFYPCKPDIFKQTYEPA